MSRTRLSPEKWLIAGVDALVASGPSALAAEPLARALGTTKGSFYWHFKDVPAFQAALIEDYRKQAVAALADAVASSGTPDHRLRKLGHLVLSDTTAPALRIWAQTDGRVAEMLATLDHERLTYINLLLREIGLGNLDFATALQATLIGLPQLAPQTDEGAIRVFDTLVDTILALS